MLSLACSQARLVDVVAQKATSQAFAALRADGEVVAWGRGFYGGDCQAVQAQLVDVVGLEATGSAFGAIRRDGSVVTWGEALCGGDSSEVESQLRGVRERLAASFRSFLSHFMSFLLVLSRIAKEFLSFWTLLGL